jgi:hypothetical protein
MDLKSGYSQTNKSFPYICCIFLYVYCMGFFFVTSCITWSYDNKIDWYYLYIKTLGSGWVTFITRFSYSEEIWPRFSRCGINSSEKVVSWLFGTNHITLLSLVPLVWRMSHSLCVKIVCRWVRVKFTTLSFISLVILSSPTSRR